MHIKGLKVFCDVVRLAELFAGGRRKRHFAVGRQPSRPSIGAAAGRQADRPLETPLRAHARGRDLLRRLPQAGRSVTTPWKIRCARLHEEVAGRVRVASIYSVGLHHHEPLLAAVPQPISQGQRPAGISASPPGLRSDREGSGRHRAGQLSASVAHGRGHCLARRADGAGLLGQPSAGRREAGRARDRCKTRTWSASTAI